MTLRVVAREAPTRDRQFHLPETSSTAPLIQRELADVQLQPGKVLPIRRSALGD